MPGSSCKLPLWTLALILILLVAVTQSVSAENLHQVGTAGTGYWLPIHATESGPAARMLHTAVWTGTEMIIWGGNGNNSTTFNDGWRYNPATDTWKAISADGGPGARSYHTAVWSGSEMIVWGGSGQGLENTGARYDPITDTWKPMSTVNAPEPRYAHAAVWTGSEMIVWGGLNYLGPEPLDGGGRYDPKTDTWKPVSTTNGPGARQQFSTVWTGSEMIIWGGQPTGSRNTVNTGAAYNPAKDTWRSISTSGAPASRYLQSAVWTGTEMIIWGGVYFNGSSGSVLDTGGRYNPVTNTWKAMSTANVPHYRYYHSAVWTGTEMIIWGGENSTEFFNTGGLYNPVNNTWLAVTTNSAPTPRAYFTAVWTGSGGRGEMIIWGGNNSQGPVNSGGRYHPRGFLFVPLVKK